MRQSDLDDIRVYRNVIANRVIEIENATTSFPSEICKRLEAQVHLIRNSLNELDIILNDAYQLMQEMKKKGE